MCFDTTEWRGHNAWLERRLERVADGFLEYFADPETLAPRAPKKLDASVTEIRTTAVLKRNTEVNELPRLAELLFKIKKAGQI